jgi:hypothetical protein
MCLQKILVLTKKRHLPRICHRKSSQNTGVSRAKFDDGSLLFEQSRMKFNEARGKQEEKYVLADVFETVAREWMKSSITQNGKNNLLIFSKKMGHSTNRFACNTGTSLPSDGRPCPIFHRKLYTSLFL